MNISERLSSIRPSATLAVNAKAMELKARGVKVVSLAVGEPDFDTPLHIREAAKAAIDEGFTRYTPVPGIPELREAAAGYFNCHYDADAEAANIIITNGGKQSLYNLLQALINPGDEVLIPTPYWVSYPALVQLAGGVPLFEPATAEQGFKITPEALAARSTPKTRVLILNSPSNPTGVCYAQEEIDAIMQWAIDNNIFVIADEIYDLLVYAPSTPVSVCKWWKRYPEQVAIVNGLAKSFAMTGWRVGYTLAHPELIKVLSKIQGQSTSNICSIAQKAAVAALTGSEETLDTMRQAFVRRRDLAHSIISTWPDVICPRPDGAFYMFIDVHRHYNKAIPDSAALATYLLEKAQVAVVPGSAFGDDTCIRISYAVADDVLENALHSIANALFK